MDKILETYVKQFGEFPPRIIEFPYSNEQYQQLIEQAIHNKEKITEESISNFIEKNNIKYGVVNEQDGDNDMDQQKIRKLLKRYGAEEQEIENFIQDLIDYKEDIEQIDEFQKDEKKGTQEYNDFAKTNNDNSDDKALKEMAKDEEKHDDYLFNAENVKLLKATKEGRDLIIKAPQMAKDELAKAIKDYLQKNK